MSHVSCSGCLQDKAIASHTIIVTDTLDVGAPTATLTANTVFGAMRGLETFSQSVYIDASSSQYLIDETSITDAPRFHHRGIMIDTARHFYDVNVILEHLDVMAYNKFNGVCVHSWFVRLRLRLPSYGDDVCACVCVCVCVVIAVCRAPLSSALAHRGRPIVPVQQHKVPQLGSQGRLQPEEPCLPAQANRASDSVWVFFGHSVCSWLRGAFPVVCMRISHFAP